MLTAHDRLALPAGAAPVAASREAPAMPGFLDLRGFLVLLRRRARLAGGVAGAVMALVVLALLLSTPRFTATSVLIVDPRQQKVLQSEAVLTGIGQDSAAVESQVEVIQSTSLARQVIDQLSLAEDPEFNRVSLVGAALDAVRGLFGGESAADPQKRQARLLARFQDNLRVKRRGLTYVLEIGFVSENAEKAARIAQAVATAYVSEGTATKRQATSQAAGWLGDRLGDLRRRVTDAERAVATYKGENNIVATGEGRTLSERQLSELNQQLVFARARTAEARARLDQVGKVSAASVGAGAIPEALQSGVIAALRGQFAEMTRREAEATSTFGPKHPTIGTMRAQMADIRREIEREIARVSAGVRNEFEVAQSRETSLERSLADLKSQSATMDQASVRLRELEREAQASRTLLEQSLLRFQETSEQDGLQRPDARILSAASPPTRPSEPKTMVLLFAGAAAALVMGIGSAVLAEGLSRGYRTPQEVESSVSLPVLAMLPLLGPEAVAATATVRAGDERPRFAKRSSRLGVAGASAPAGPPGMTRYGVDQPLSPFGEAIRTVRMRLRSEMTGASHVLVVASSIPGEGKSTVAINLAHSFAKSGPSTLLIDVDARKPSVAPGAGGTGLVQLLSGEDDGGPAIYVDAASGLHLLPMGRVSDVADASERIGGERMKALLARMRARFQVIILDAPPLLPFADTRHLLSEADSAVLVVEWGRTDAAVVTAALGTLGRNAPRVAGIVLNKVDVRSYGDYGYGYGQGYGQGYGKAG